MLKHGLERDVIKQRVTFTSEDSNETNDEFTSEEKALMVRNHKKLFKKNFAKLRGNNSSRSENKGSEFRGNNSYS